MDIDSENKHSVFIGLGSNKGNKRKYIEGAILLLDYFVGKITGISELRESEPWGYNSSSMYLNGVVRLDTVYSPHEILDRISAIERELGRTRTPEAETYEDRTIDLDILFYDDIVVEDDRLSIPHPRVQVREFVLQPMCDISPDFVHPILKKSMADLLSELYHQKCC